MQDESPLTLARLAAALEPVALEPLGGFAVAEGEDGFPPGTRTLVLLGPKQPAFWPHVTAQPEWADGRPHPVDRWSRRAIGQVAREVRAEALFPFGGPPWHPFFHWALRTGQCWESPVRLLVHASQGLWVSFRGALALREAIAMPRGDSPCATCVEKPCLTACPAGALGAAGYDVPRCHDWLDTEPGKVCLSEGCLVRGACPVSKGHARMPEQSAYHMGQFHR